MNGAPCFVLTRQLLCQDASPGERDVQAFIDIVGKNCVCAPSQRGTKHPGVVKSSPGVEQPGVEQGGRRRNDQSHPYGSARLNAC